MKRVSLVLFVVCCAFTTSVAQQDYAHYVNPFIGTGGHGHTFPGAIVPFGMVQLSPDTRIDGSWDGCSGYHYSDSIIYGFSHTHLSGTGISDYGDVMLMPLVNKKAFSPKEYSSSFKHSNEKAEAGYYAVKLDNGVLTELTTTNRVGLHRYTFPAGAQPSLAFDFSHRDECTEAYLKMESPTRVVGYRRSRAWATDQYVAFVIEFSKPVIGHIVSIDGKESNPLEVTATNAKVNFKFPMSAAPLMVKVAISSVDMAGADKNLKAELPHWDFEDIRTKATRAWNKELGKIQITTSDAEKMKIFYTALYHVFTHPSTASDVDGRYRGMDKKIYVAKDYTHYTIFSLWDTFRALHPLMTIVDQKRTNDFIHSFMSMYEQGGRLPVWELAANETDCMIGYHSISVMADAAVKGITNVDLNKAFEAMKKSATWPHLGLPAYMENGVITIDDEHESVSKTLEYAYDDFCIAQVAKLLKREEDYQVYMKRSLSYRNLFDKETGFMRPKKNGGWLTPFDPREVNNHFTEANSWQYSFFAPHDVKGHMELLGGTEAYEAKLDQLFTTSSATTGREQADITGLIGQYAHGNEPSHHMAYLYNYAGKPAKTQERIREILTTLYHNAPDGLSGNEDCGQMSAWYVLSSIGLYQVCPGVPDFTFGSPLFDKVVINLENGKSLSITASNNLMANKFIAGAVLNNVPLTSPVIQYQQLMNGGELAFTMSDKTQQAFSVVPVLESTGSFVAAPVFQGSGKSFKNSAAISIIADPSTTVYYTVDGSTPTEKSMKYAQSVRLDQTTTLRAVAIASNGISSSIAKASFYKFPGDWTVKLNAVYNPQYTAGGDDGIIDGIRGNENWRKGEWQGYQKQDFEVIIDLKKATPLSTIGAGFLQDTRAWILMPTKMEVEVSSDGKNYKKVGVVENKLDAQDYTVQVQELTVTFKPTQARYVKIKAYNFGKLPPWHLGHPFDGDAFIFVDEVWVK